MLHSHSLGWLGLPATCTVLPLMAVVVCSSSGMLFGGHSGGYCLLHRRMLRCERLQPNTCCPPLQANS
jgi:predicted membrane metal-binding protein